jgi:glycosyltransferase involved in cell wall biosynthesis
VTLSIALVTNFIPPYRVPLFTRLAEDLDIEVICFGGRARFTPAWFRELDSQVEAAAFPARRLAGRTEPFTLGRNYSAIIAPFAGGSLLPTLYASSRAYRKPFILWASVWSDLTTARHRVARPIVHHIYRCSSAVVTYGEHVAEYVAPIRGTRDGIFVAPQVVEKSIFGNHISESDIETFRTENGLTGPLVLYAGRLVEEKGFDVLLTAWREVSEEATLVVIGEGPLRGRAEVAPRVRTLAPLPRERLPVAYAAALFTVLPSITTRGFREPWGLVCNEAMHQRRPLVVSEAVGAVAGGLVRHEVSGLVVPEADAASLRDAMNTLLVDHELRSRLGDAARSAVEAVGYEECVTGFRKAVEHARRVHEA